MLYTLKKGEYPEGHRYWSNATADLTAPDGAEELGAERPDLHVVFAEDVDQWKANDPFTEIWVVMPWDVDADAFHEVADWLDSRCRFNE